MPKSLLQIRDQLVEARNDTHADILIDIGTSLAAKTKNYKRMLSVIDVVTKNLQTSCHTLRECREGLDTLLDAVAEEREGPGPALFGCKLK